MLNLELKAETYMLRGALRIFLAFLFFGLLFLSFSKTSFADTTPYKSASIITTDEIGGNTFSVYTDLSNCSATDGLTCNRGLGVGFGNLYFRDFGDFGIPAGSIITAVRIRVTGKSDTALFAGVSAGTIYSANCQTPSDKWRMVSLFGSSIQTFEVTSSSGVDFTFCLNSTNIRSNNFIFRINFSGPSPWSSNIDNFEIAFDYTPAGEITPSPTSTPTPLPTSTPTPTPAPPPDPFLDLPWDFAGKGLSFNEAALNINSFFDHEYPLLSTNLSEPNEAQNSIISYKGGVRDFDSDYSRHDGYDYGSLAQANFGDPVLAAAAGTATFVSTETCEPCGNAIYIDHGNGYQTRYYHLQSDGLITNLSGQSIQVNAGQQIGRVGATGKTTGAHIHFMVVEDKNDDENFDDNIPDGLVDPFGWQSTDPDPWESYKFFYNGQDRTGNKSYYLWNKKIDGLNANLTANGGVFNSGRNTVTFPEGATNKNLLLEIISAPIQKISDLISSVGSSVQINAKDTSGNEVTDFDHPFTVGINFTDFDLTRFLTDTLSIYSSSDGIDWVKEDTSIDLENKTATAEVDHLTYFALMAERKDTQAATTTAILVGDEGEDGHFHSVVSVSLEAVDNEDGLGVDYILYRKGDEDWQEYISPIQFSNESEYSVEFYSVDNDGNIEEPKSVAFSIDKTPPEAEIYYSLPNKNIQFDGKDSSGSASVTLENIARNKKIVVTDEAGNTLTAIGSVFNSKNLSWLSIDSLQYNNLPQVKQDRNNFLTVPLYDRKTNQLKSITQIYSVKDKNIIGIVYSVAADKTKVYTYDRKNKQIFKEELPGMHLLKLTTENATLNYSYLI